MAEEETQSSTGSHSTVMLNLYCSFLKKQIETVLEEEMKIFL